MKHERKKERKKKIFFWSEKRYRRKVFRNENENQASACTLFTKV